ncbi:Uncharacterised protein [Bordetella pertussis]|nr:Uncharacterised protein [Bordetella pertussis]
MVWRCGARAGSMATTSSALITRRSTPKSRIRPAARCEVSNSRWSR